MLRIRILYLIVVGIDVDLAMLKNHLERVDVAIFHAVEECGLIQLQVLASIIGKSD